MVSPGGVNVVLDLAAFGAASPSLRLDVTSFPTSAFFTNVFDNVKLPSKIVLDYWMLARLGPDEAGCSLEVDDKANRRVKIRIFNAGPGAWRLGTKIVAPGVDVENSYSLDRSPERALTVKYELALGQGLTLTLTEGAATSSQGYNFETPAAGANGKVMVQCGVVAASVGMGGVAVDDVHLRPCLK